MKSTIYILVLSLFFTLPGCVSSYDSDLLEIDGIIDSNPRLAYSKIKEIDHDKLPGRSNNALYALLLTQAQYKNMILIKSDSLIDCALDYYKYNDDREKYVRSLIYKGAALSDMGDREDAILWYKRAVEQADSTDYMNLGQANLRMAELYRDSYILNNKYFDNYKKAIEYYRKAGNKKYEQKCLKTLGALYRNQNKDSVYFYLNSSIELSKENNDKTAYYSSYLALARAYWHDSLYDSSKNAALYVIRNGSDFINVDMCYHDLSRTYARLGIVDSADYYLRQTLAYKSKEQHVANLITLTEIEKARGNYKKAYDFKVLSSDIASSAVNNAASKEFYRIEKRFDKKSLELDNMSMHRRNSLYGLVISIALLVIFILVAVIVRRKNQSRDNETLIEQLRLQSIESEKMLIKNLEKNADSPRFLDSVESLKQAFGNQISTIKHLIDYSYQYNSNPESFMKEFNRVIKINMLSEGMWRDLHCYVNENCNNVIKDVSEKFKQLSTQELNFISLMCCRFSNIEIMLCMGYSNERSVCNKRIIISKKMEIGMPLEKYLSKYMSEQQKEAIDVENSVI